MSTNNQSGGAIIVSGSFCMIILMIFSILTWIYVDNKEKSPSPLNCDVKWDESSWKPCDENTCGDAKGSEYHMYQYRTGLIKQAAKHGGRECPDLLQFEQLNNDSSSSSSASADDPPVSSQAASYASPFVMPVQPPTVSSRPASYASPSVMPVQPPTVSSRPASYASPSVMPVQPPTVSSRAPLPIINPIFNRPSTGCSIQ